MPAQSFISDEVKMSFWKTISNAVYKEYDRRIKRASLITEYGAAHHGDHAADHAGDAHAEEDEAEIVNIPRGTPVQAAGSTHHEA